MITTKTTYRGNIRGMTVSSRYPYIVYGDCRGLVSEHRTASGAERSRLEDCRGCACQGGYSDADAYHWEGGQWVAQEECTNDDD